MKTVTKIFELQLDEKPNDYVIRLNDKDKCILRICQIPKDIMISDGMVDVVYSESYPEFIKKMDWKLLREQKEIFIKVLYAPDEGDDDDVPYLEGILHLIDAIQDYAIDEAGFTEKEVFDLPEEEEM